jgi:hypothetical protein
MILANPQRFAAQWIFNLDAGLNKLTVLDLRPLRKILGQQPFLLERHRNCSFGVIASVLSLSRPFDLALASLGLCVSSTYLWLEKGCYLRSAWWEMN